MSAASFSPTVRAHTCLRKEPERWWWALRTRLWRAPCWTKETHLRKCVLLRFTRTKHPFSKPYEHTNTLALLISSHARAHRHMHKHPPGLSSSALVSFAWGFLGSMDPFLILQQKHQTKANKMKVQTSSLGYQLCVFRRSQMVAILPKSNVKQKHTLDETNPSSLTTVSQIKCITFRSKYLFFACFGFFCILLWKGAFIQDTSLWCQLTFLKNVSFI